MGKEIDEALNDSVKRLLNNLGTMEWIDLAVLRNEVYPTTLGDKERLIQSLIIKR